jgi:hypothetical protein
MWIVSLQAPPRLHVGLSPLLSLSLFCDKRRSTIDFFIASELMEGDDHASMLTVKSKGGLFPGRRGSTLSLWGRSQNLWFTMSGLHLTAEK